MPVDSKIRTSADSANDLETATEGNYLDGEWLCRRSIMCSESFLVVIPNMENFRNFEVFFSNHMTNLLFSRDFDIV